MGLPGVKNHPTKKGVPFHSVFSLVLRGPFSNPRTTKVQGDLFAIPQHDRSWTNSEAFDSLGPMERNLRRDSKIQNAGMYVGQVRWTMGVVALELWREYIIPN